MGKRPKAQRGTRGKSPSTPAAVSDLDPIPGLIDEVEERAAAFAKLIEQTTTPVDGGLQVVSFWRANELEQEGAALVGLTNRAHTILISRRGEWREFENAYGDGRDRCGVLTRASMTHPADACACDALERIILAFALTPEQHALAESQGGGVRPGWVIPSRNHGLFESARKTLREANQRYSFKPTETPPTGKYEAALAALFLAWVHRGYRGVTVAQVAAENGAGTIPLVSVRSLNDFVPRLIEDQLAERELSKRTGKRPERGALIPSKKARGYLMYNWKEREWGPQPAGLAG